MNPRIKEAWIQALRSGKYQQGRGLLRRDDPETEETEYCCLGVLCDLAARDCGSGYWDHEGNYRDGTGFLGKSLLPHSVIAWAGCGEQETTLCSPVEYTVSLPPSASRAHPAHLHVINDSGATFEQIADLIEEQL